MFCFRHVFVPGTLHLRYPRPSLLANTSELSANMSGDVILEFIKGHGSPAVILSITGCLYVENLGKNFISVKNLADKGFTSIFRAGTVGLTVEPKNLILGRGMRDREDSSLLCPALC
jgi:hypothetical protein